MDDFVYQQGGSNNAAIFNVLQGTVAFVAQEVAKTGNMKIDTPTASLGIRGTSGLVQIPSGAATGTPGEVAIKLYPDADGRVGRIEVFGRDGAQLGTLTRGASGFAIRPGPAGGAQRFTAVPLRISAQEAERDRTVVRQTFAARTVGRQINIERRNAQPNQPRQNLPRQNLPRQNQPQQNLPRQNEQRLPQQQRLPGQQGQPGLQRTPTLQQQRGQPGTPAPQQLPAVTTPRGAQPLPVPPGGARPAQQGQPGALPPAGGQPALRGQPGALPPAGARPALQPRPAFPRTTPHAPAPQKKGKKGR